MATPDASPPPRASHPRLRLLLAVALPALAAALIVVVYGYPRADRAGGLPPPAAAGGTDVQAGLAPAADGPRRGRPAEPLRISIPGAGVAAPVDSVRVRDGALRVPAVGRAGWFEGGPRPGEVGRAVIIGHLDTRSGPALFARVPDLEPGTPVSVTDRGGEIHRYRVTRAAQVAKARFPTREVYGRADAPVLVLVTCGGKFVAGSGYTDNILVYARAV